MMTRRLVQCQRLAITCLTVLLAGPGAVIAAEPARRESPGVVAPRNPVPSDVRRVTILVNDIEASLKLYRDALGFQVNYDAPITVSGVNLPAGVPGNKTRLVLLNGNDAFIGWIGLMQYTDPPLPDPGPYPKRLGRGSHVVILNSVDARTYCGRVKAVPGVHLTVDYHTTRYPGRGGGPPIEVAGCNFFDPDGTFIELTQLLPAKAAP